MTELQTVTRTVDLADLSRENGGSQHLRAFVAEPATPGPRPGVVLVMEIFGVNDDMRAHAERIAGWGYTVVVPDLYSDGGARRCLVATMRSLTTGTGKAVADIESARRWLELQPQVTDAVGIIGFCMGGGFALLTCDRERYAVASANYGRVPEDLGHACPVVGSYGARDRQNPDAARHLRDRLEKAGVAHDVREYPDSGHAFLNDSLPGPRALAPLWHVAGFGGSREDAEDAWARIERYFAAHLKQTPGTAGTATA
ncbi:dienelactone hydrolase family protein [Kocuria sp.]|uniref:dienelactone hydrolase family protein n=1 Tax=Kocuria sp. TaxID=1871328 RepID=UPI0026DD9EE3|nr:dienelactone hydrolase family protein [Kocuria sp.]MDO4918132.1 dienelactone hydrolase family protein [Kocuria sp.]